MAGPSIREALESAISAVVPSAEAASSDGPNMQPKWLVINHKTGMQVGGPYSTAQRARNVMDRKDNEYGGYAHKIVEMPEPK